MLDAGSTLDVKSGGAMRTQSGGTMSMKAGGDMALQGGSDIHLNTAGKAQDAEDMVVSIPPPKNPVAGGPR
jgi:hypothetical protein